MASTTDMDLSGTGSCMARVDHVHQPRAANERTRGYSPRRSRAIHSHTISNTFHAPIRSAIISTVAIRSPFVRRMSGGVASPARSIVLLPGRSLREVLFPGRDLSGREHPRRILVLGRPREVRAKERANQLATDSEFGRDRLGPGVLDSRHASVLSFARTLRAFACNHMVAAIGRMCAYALFGFCKRSFERSFVIGRALSVRATGRALSDVTTPPSTPMREESRVGFLRGGEIATLDLSYSTK